MSEVKIVISGNASGAVAAVGATDKALDKLGTTGAAIAPRVLAPLQAIPGALAPVLPALAPLAPAMERVGAAGAGMAKAVGVSAGQTAAAFRQLPAQLTDVATQLAGGQSPLLVLLQQGGQVKDSFGGIGPAARALSGYFTPLAVGAAAVAAALGGVALAAYQGRSEAAELAKALLLTGNYAGTSAGQFAGMAADISAASKVTIGSARELLAATEATGAFGAQSIGSVTAAMARLQSISGASAADVVADFTSMSRNVTAWAVEHNRQYAFMTKAEYDQIKALQEHGRVEEAMALTAGKLDKALADRQPQLGALQKLWKSVGEEASKTWDIFMGLGRDLTMEDKLAQVKVQIAANARRTDRADSVGPSGMRKGADKRDAELRQEEADLVQSIYRRNEMQSVNAEAAAKTRQQIDDAASGKADALKNAKANLSLARARNASALTLAGLSAEQQAVDAAHQIGLLSDQAYADAKIGIIRREVTQQAAEKRREIEIENARPTNGPASETEKAAKAAALMGQLAAIETDGAKRIAEAYSEADKAKVQSGRDHAQQWADAWARANDQVRALASSTADLRIGLIQDPQAQDRARTDKLIDDKRRALDRSLPELANSGNDGKALELAKATDDEIAALNDGLAERLKPAWQKQLEAWRDNNRLMRDSYASMMDGVLKNAEDAWVQLATSGKLNVHNLVNGILQEMARVQFKQFAASLMGGGGGGGGGFLGSIIGAVGSFMGVPSTYIPTGGTGDFARLDRLSGGRAAGGSVSANSLYLVGERGPELLRMGAQGGSVIPNHAFAQAVAGSGGGSPVQVTYAPVLNIDSRTDQAQVVQLVSGALDSNNRQLMALLRAKRVL